MESRWGKIHPRVIGDKPHWRDGHRHSFLTLVLLRWPPCKPLFSHHPFPAAFGVTGTAQTARWECSHAGTVPQHCSALHSFATNPTRRMPWLLFWRHSFTLGLRIAAHVAQHRGPERGVSTLPSPFCSARSCWLLILALLRAELGMKLELLQQHLMCHKRAQTRHSPSSSWADRFKSCAVCPLCF